ncbi:hypothetical protein E3E12_01125 [Formicincola oecophyllae]|uniref:Uncharacterized protein n=1 Tax=Formicincola oecophyllae TaxID=2558361 RepID=A0A4Y6U776_9PROT|nr:hypothetical protein [Formicincola oecophyllae]QDH13024.1 hypothetical protein E3E12_01125 [Formicincola oecophyllae]
MAAMTENAKDVFGGVALTCPCPAQAAPCTLLGADHDEEDPVPTGQCPDSNGQKQRLMADDTHISEESMRLALAKLGMGRKDGPTPPDAQPSPARIFARTQARPQAARPSKFAGKVGAQPVGAQADAQRRLGASRPSVGRRRFAAEGTVVVEHQALGPTRAEQRRERQQGKSHAGPRVTVLHTPDENTPEGDMQRLRAGLAAAERRAHDAEAELVLLRQRLRSVETNEGTLRLKLQETEERTNQLTQDLITVRLALEKARAAATPKVAAEGPVGEDESAPSSKRTRGRPRKAPLPRPASQSPEPVQWWKD